MVLSGCTLWSEPEPTPVNTAVVIEETCLAERTISDATNFLTTWSWDGSLPALSAATATAYPDIKQNQEDYFIADQPLLLWDEATGTVGVNNAYFSELKFVDATTLTGQPFTVGTLNTAQLTDTELQQVMLFLMDTLVIRTYAHIDADVCLDNEIDSADQYLAHISAVHRFCTNSCDEAAYDFSVTINKATGQIVVQ